MTKISMELFKQPTKGRRFLSQSVGPQKWWIRHVQLFEGRFG